MFRKYVDAFSSALINLDYAPVYLVSGLLINMAALYALWLSLGAIDFYYLMGTFLVFFVFTMLMPVYSVYIIKTIREKGRNLAVQTQPYIKYSKQNLLDAWADFFQVPFSYNLWVLTFSAFASLAIWLPAILPGKTFGVVSLTLDALTTIAIFLPIFPALYAFFYIALLVKKIYNLQILDIQINVFNLFPIYSISQLTQKLAIYLLPYATFFGIAGGYYNYIGNPSSMIIAWQVVGLLSLALSIFVFIAPVLWLKKLIHQQKEKLLIENALRIHSLITEQNQRIDKGHPESAGDLNNIVDNLIQRQILISHISEWPWNSVILKEFVATLFVPIIIWISQYYLSKII